MPHAKLRSLIEKNLSYIKSCQEDDGSFGSYSGDERMELLVSQKTPFITSLILNALSGAKDDQRVIDISEKAVKMLLAEKSPHWTWNYWPRNGDKAKFSPVPDDLDDTFCALSAIYGHKPELVSNEILPRAVKVLTMSEVQAGGPYNTWIMKDARAPRWHDIDVVVNCNVGYFLKLVGVEMDSIASLAERTIRHGLYSTRYYKSLHSVLYFISRSYKGPETARAIKDVLAAQLPDGTWGDPLKTALCVTALINFGFDEKTEGAMVAAMAYLKGVSESSSWEAFPFYVEESKEFPSYAGSPALTAALVTESLLLWSKATSPAEQTRKNAATAALRRKKERATAIQDAMKRKILDEALMAYEHAPAEILATARKTLDSITSHDALSQVTLLPYFTFRAMTGVSMKKKKDQDRSGA